MNLKLGDAVRITPWCVTSFTSDANLNQQYGMKSRVKFSTAGAVGTNTVTNINDTYHNTGVALIVVN